MGSSIAAALLAAGHPVAGVEVSAARRRAVPRRVRALLEEMAAEGLLRGSGERRLRAFTVSGDYAALRGCALVVEAIYEDETWKREALQRVEDTVGARTIIGCNTSAIPIGELQREARYPQRIAGVHWAEPAHVTRFLEVIQGEATAPATVRRILALARAWGKEPTLVRHDIRGFITNRCFYALLREALYLVENGYATPADVDRSLRNDLGYWITFAGPFRFIDLTGLPAYAAVARDLFPELSNETRVPAPLATLAASGARGTANARGFYRYTPAQARRWQKRFLEFTYEIRRLAQRYPEDAGDRPSRRGRPSA